MQLFSITGLETSNLQIVQLKNKLLNKQEGSRYQLLHVQKHILSDTHR